MNRQEKLDRIDTAMCWLQGIGLDNYGVLQALQNTRNIVAESEDSE